jgi:general stress protein 26
MDLMKKRLKKQKKKIEKMWEKTTQTYYHG